MDYTSSRNKFSCGYVGVKGGHWLELLMSILLCGIGGMHCYAGGVIIGLARKQ